MRVEGEMPPYSVIREPGNLAPCFDVENTYRSAACSRQKWGTRAECEGLHPGIELDTNNFAITAEISNRYCPISTSHGQILPARAKGNSSYAHFMDYARSLESCIRVPMYSSVIPAHG